MRHRNPCIQWEICVPCSTHKSIHITIEFVIHICTVSIEDSFSLSTVISCLLLYFICFQKKKSTKNPISSGEGGRGWVGSIIIHGQSFEKMNLIHDVLKRTSLHVWADKSSLFLSLIWAFC